MKSLHRTLWLWIACFAFLMNALAPAISHAVAFGKGKPPVWEICRADGSRLVISGDIDFSTFLAVTGGGKDLKSVPKSRQTGMSMGEDCGYCATHAGSFGMPPPAVASLPAAGQGQIHPFLFYRAPQPLAAWSASRPRGPPAQV
jgi:hypothetical protein